MLNTLLKLLWPESLITRMLVVGVVAGLSFYFLTRRRHRLPPGPPGWPVLGNIPELQGSLFMKLRALSQKYGPVMTIHLGRMRIVILSRIDAVTEALVKRGGDVAGRPRLFSGLQFTDEGRDIVMGDYSPRWKLHRKLASKAIRHYLTSDALEKKILESLRIATNLMKAEPGAFSPSTYLSLLIFNILSLICFNKSSPDASDDRFRLYVGAMEKLTEGFEGGFMEDWLPPWRLLPNTHFRKTRAFVATLHASIAKEVEGHRRTFSPDSVRDFTDAILLAQNEAEKEEDPEVLAQITDRHVIQTVFDVFNAGVDTSRQTLNWALLVLAIHQDIQLKVQQEVDQVIGSDLAVTLSDRGHLPYTEAVLHEVMRMWPVAPLGVPHMTLTDTSVGGHEIPKGTMVIINHYALHYDADQWEDANTFNPERFLDASGKMAPKPDSWLPFSAGRRVCLGETLAKPELHLTLAGLLRAFTISLAPGETVTLETKTTGSVNLPARYKIVVTPRH